MKIIKEKIKIIKNNASIEFSLKYVFALIMIACLLITNQFVTHFAMEKKASDSIIINVSGRQRMLNQSIIKESMRFYYNDNKNDFSNSVNNLKNLLLLWEDSQNALINGDAKLSIPEEKPKIIEELFIDIDPFFNKILDSTKELLVIVENRDYVKTDIEHLIIILKENEEMYLNKMDNIVDAYELESIRKLNRLNVYTWGLMFLVLFALLLEMIFIFKPIENKISITIKKIQKSEENLQQLFDVSPSPLILVKVSDLTIVKINKIAFETITSDCENVVGTSINKFILNDSLLSVNLSHIEKECEIKLHCEIRIRDAKGNIHHALVCVKKNTYFEDEVYILGITDISERRKNEVLLERLAQIDEMTGLFNRRTGISFLEKEIARCDRTNEELVIAFIDLDNLKYVNDTFGHIEGDLFIRSFSKCVLENIREEDVALRYGGDEFIIILKRCTLENAKAILEIISCDLKKMSKELNKDYLMDLSYGFSKYAIGSFKSVETFIDVADEDMYKNKVYKKNICLSSNVVS